MLTGIMSIICWKADFSKFIYKVKPFFIAFATLFRVPLITLVSNKGNLAKK